jgi:hypothetical protein
VLSNGTSTNTPGGHQTKANTSFEFHAKLQGNTVMVSVRAPDLKNPSVALFDMRGIKLADINPETAESGICQFALPKDFFNSGVTVLRLRDSGTLMSRNAVANKWFLLNGIH